MFTSSNLLFLPVLVMQLFILWGDAVETLHAAQSGEMAFQISELLGWVFNALTQLGN